MKDLTVDELQQLIMFYRQKAMDLELELLQAQLKISKLSIVANETKNVKSK